MPSVISNLCAAFRFETRDKSSSEIIFYTNPRQKIDQSIAGKYYPSVNDPARANNVPGGRHGGRCDHRAIYSPTFWNPNPSTVAVSDLRRDLETLLCPGSNPVFASLPKILKTNQKFLKTKKYSQLLVTES